MSRALKWVDLDNSVVTRVNELDWVIKETSEGEWVVTFAGAYQVTVATLNEAKEFVGRASGIDTGQAGS